MKVNLAVCGKFHHANYVKRLSEEGILNRFYYSHKWSTDAESMGIKPNEATNYWLKEYLLHGHIRVLNQRMANFFYPLYQTIWETQVLLNWKPADLAHIMSQGTASNLVRDLKKAGTPIILEPVNAHPALVTRLLNEEYARLGILKKIGLNHGQERQLLELPFADYLLVPSKFVEKSFIDEGFPSNKIKVIPYAVDLSRFSVKTDETTGKQKFRVVCVSQISLRKAHVDLIQAWKKLNLPNSELILAGNLTDEMKFLEKEFTGSIKYVGAVPWKDIPELLRSSDAFVLPSLEEGCSLAPLEAMASGLPVIVSENTGSGEQVVNGETGFVVPIRNPEAIAQAIETLFQNRKIKDAMGAEAARRSRESMGWDQYASHLISFYKKILEQHQV